MDINKYIESLTKIDTNQRLDNVEWSAVPKNENVNLSYKKNLPSHLEIAKGFYDQSNIKNLEKKEDQNDDSLEKNWGFQFADIRSSVREIGLGWNIYSGFEKRYRESQESGKEKLVQKCSSESDLSYTTVSCLTDDSYNTAKEDFQHLRRPSVDVKSEISIISSVDKDRYKKNALITGLIQRAESDFSGDEIVTDCSTDQCDTSHLLNDIHNENNNEEKWDSDTNEKEMYKDRVFRLFQSKEDEDVYVHPLREQIKEDPVWKEFRLSRQGLEVTETARQYYLNLADEDFEIFEKVESKVESKTKKRLKSKSKKSVKRNRYLF